MSTIGKNIQIRRKALGLTQEELALKVGYKSKSTINKIELGINDIPQSKIVRFAEVLDTTPAYLMGWQDSPLSVTTATPEYTKHEQAVIAAYRAQPDLQPAVDRLLGIEKDGYVTLYTAAHSINNNPDGYIRVPIETWKQIEDVPDTDEDLL